MSNPLQLAFFIFLLIAVHGLQVSDRKAQTIEILEACATQEMEDAE